MSAPAWAIDCLTAPGSPKTGWYSWREIDGRKCWFKKTGAMPAKSQLHWATEEVRPVDQVSPVEETSEPVAPPHIAPPPAAPVEPVEPKRPTAPQLRSVRVNPVPVTSARLGSGQIDLMNGARLSAVPVFGSARPKAGRPAPADAFDARFTGRGD